jgi:hypothetical protein
MPPVSQAQRKLMYAAAFKTDGVDGVPQKVGEEFAKSDEGGKLPKRKKSVLYDKSK